MTVRLTMRKLIERLIDGDREISGANNRSARAGSAGLAVAASGKLDSAAPPN